MFSISGRMFTGLARSAAVRAPAVGKIRIDLGTANSRVVVMEGAAPKVLENSEGMRVIKLQFEGFEHRLVLEVAQRPRENMESTAETEHKGWCDTELTTNKQTRGPKAEEVNKLTAEKEGLSTIAQLTQDVQDRQESKAKAKASEKPKPEPTMAMSKQVRSAWNKIGHETRKLVKEGRTQQDIEIKTNPLRLHLRWLQLAEAKALIKQLHADSKNA